VFVIDVQPASADDLVELRAFILAFSLEDGHPIAPDALERALSAVAQSEPLLHVWMIRMAGRNVGYVALGLGFSIEVGGLDAFLDELYVLPEARGLGLGRAALAFAETQAQRLGVRRLCLEVEHHNARARALYTELGYAAHARHLMSKLL
jgi:ribosomal protein S18 acetylase RimI-like enzyme